MIGYEPEPQEVEAFVSALRLVTDPSERYSRASAEQVLHEAVGRELARLRALAVLEMHEGGASFSSLAYRTGLSRGRIQQLVDQGRAIRLPGSAF